MNDGQNITTTRRTDDELNMYFGGRDAYLTHCQQELEALQKSATEPQITDPFMDEFFASIGVTDLSSEISRNNRIATIRAAIAANL